jgi:hypothetical protein
LVAALVPVLASRGAAMRALNAPIFVLRSVRSAAVSVPAAVSAAMIRRFGR